MNPYARCVRPERMLRVRGERPDASDPVLLVGTGHAGLRADLVARLARGPGHDRGAPGRRPGSKVLAASSVAVVRSRCGPAVSALVVDLGMRGALDLVRALRDARPELPILAVASGAPASDAIAAVMAGADFFHACREGRCPGVERALEHALERRRLIAVIDRSESQLEEARGKLAQLSGDLVGAIPGFRPLQARGDVLPFREAARRYLLAAGQLFEGEPRGLAKALGVSYFALRRLLARYEVPYPGPRSRKHGTRPR